MQKTHKNLPLKRCFAQSILKIILSALGTIGAYYLCMVTSPGSQTVAHLITVVALIFLPFFWFKIFIPNTKSQTIFHSLFAFILSTILIIGGELNNFTQIIWNISTIAKIILGSFTVFPFLEIFLSLFNAISQKKDFQLTKKHRFIAFFVPFIACLIVWIIYLPGIYTYDMASWNEMYSTGTISSHWSIIYGLFLAGFLDSGYALSGNYEIGFGIAMFIQLLFICFVIYKIITFATAQTKNRYLFYGSLLFFVLNPFILVMSITDAQDVIFGGILALLTIELFQATHNNNYFQRKIHIIYLVFLALTLTLFRNNGVICLGLCLLLILFIKAFNKKILLLSLTGTIIFSLIITGPIYQLAGVAKNTTSIQEILGVPTQQLARSYYENPSSFDEEDTAKMHDFYNIEKSTFHEYQSYPLISDFTKSTMKSDYTKEHLFEYIILWSKIGFKNLTNYTEAFLLNSFGFWYPNKNYADSRINPDYMNYPGFIMTGAFSDPDIHPNMKSVSHVFSNSEPVLLLDNLVFNNGYYNIPIIAEMSSIGLYTLLCLYSIGIIIIRKLYRLLIVLGPTLGLLLTLFLAPVAIFRYAFPLALLIPIFLQVLITQKKAN